MATGKPTARDVIVSREVGQGVRGGVMVVWLVVYNRKIVSQSKTKHGAARTAKRLAKQHGVAYWVERSKNRGAYDRGD